MEQKKEKVNIYKTLQQMRVELQKRGITKSGRNEYSKFDYYELSDFLPHCNEIMNNHDIVAIYRLLKESAELSLINCNDLNEKIVFSIPLAEVSIKGAAGIQNVGGLTTYTRRYLYMIAFEISESDELDPATGNPEQQPEQNEVYYVDEVKIKVIRAKMDEKGVTENQILERYKLASLEEMTVNQFVSCMNGLEKTPTPEKQKVDLGF